MDDGWCASMHAYEHGSRKAQLAPRPGVVARKAVQGRSAVPLFPIVLNNDQPTPDATMGCPHICGGAFGNSETNRTDRSEGQRRWPHFRPRAEAKAATAGRSDARARRDHPGCRSIAKFLASRAKAMPCREQ